MEDWERTYNLETATIRRISQYTGMNFKETLQLPYSFFLLLSKESWIDSYNRYPETREILKNLWRLRQTEADTGAISRFQHRKEG